LRRLAGFFPSGSQKTDKTRKLVLFVELIPCQVPASIAEVQGDCGARTLEKREPRPVV